MQPTLIQHIEFRKNRSGQERAFVGRTRVRVQDLANDHEIERWDADEIARNYPHITIAQVHAALAFYFDNRELVQQYIRQDAAYAESMREELTRPKATDDDSVPS